MRLFDTTFVIDLVAGDPEAASLARQIDQERSFRAISAVTAHEYLRGIFALYRTDARTLEAKLRAAESELGRFEIIPYTLEIARAGARLDAELAATGARLSCADVLLTATALHLGLSLVTRDGRGFRRVPDLRVESY